MRIIIIDLHCNDFYVRNFGRILAHNMVKSYKHQFLLSYFLEKKIPIFNLITDKGTTASFPYSFFTRKLRLFRVLESYYVEKKNKLPLIRTISLENIRRDDVIIGYMVFSNNISSLSVINSYKLVFGNHFVSIDSPLDLGFINTNGFVNEIDLSHNDFIKNFIKLGSADNILLPYVFSSRFCCKKKFNERTNKVMAVGTASTCKDNQGYSLYREYFKTEKIQPMRWKILENKSQLKDIIDCYIGDIRTGAINKRIPKGIIDKIIWKFQSAKQHNQSDYTSFDMVETFNNYKMFVCPEELVGMPGIGAIEGMACGTAYIGIDHDMYKSLGLIPGVHYITYDGTLEGLIDVIREYQNRSDDVERIAKTGMEYVRKHFNEKAIQESFISQLRDSYERYLDQLNNHSKL